MTSNKLKHEARKQEWAVRIQECRSSGLPVRTWCRQQGTTPATYYRWERELLNTIDPASHSSLPAVSFAELPIPKQTSCNVSERSATLRIGDVSLDIYHGCDEKQLKILVELIRLC